MVSILFILFLLALATRLPVALLIMLLFAGGAGFFFNVSAPSVTPVLTQEPAQAIESDKVYKHSPILDDQKEVNKHVKSPIRVRD